VRATSDVLLGCIAQVKVGGKVIKVEATRDEYLRTYGHLLNGGDKDQQAGN